MFVIVFLKQWISFFALPHPWRRNWKRWRLIFLFLDTLGTLKFIFSSLIHFGSFFFNFAFSLHIYLHLLLLIIAEQGLPAPLLWTCLSNISARLSALCWLLLWPWKTPAHLRCLKSILQAHCRDLKLALRDHLKHLWFGTEFSSEELNKASILIQWLNGNIVINQLEMDQCAFPSAAEVTVGTCCAQRVSMDAVAPATRLACPWRRVRPSP